MQAITTEKAIVQLLNSLRKIWKWVKAAKKWHEDSQSCRWFMTSIANEEPGNNVSPERSILQFSLPLKAVLPGIV